MVRCELCHVGEDGHPPAVRSIDDVLQRWHPSGDAGRSGDRQQRLAGSLAQRGDNIAGIEGPVLTALDVPAAGGRGPGKQVSVMLGHRRDHDVVSAEPEPVGKATDRLGRIAAGPGPVLRDGSGFGSVTTRC